MASDPTLPARLAALGFEGPTCRMCNGYGECIPTPGEGWGTCPNCDGHGFDLQTGEAEDAALRLLAGRLAGKRVPVDIGWTTWAGMPTVRSRGGTLVTMGRFGLRCDGDMATPHDMAAAMLAMAEDNEPLARAALHLVGLEQAVAWAEGVL